MAGTTIAASAACGSSAPAPQASEKTTDTAKQSSAAPAAAAVPEFNGTYELVYSSDGLTRTWLAVSCGPGCADITQDSKDFLTPSTVVGQAHVDGTRWELKIRRPDAVVCSDESEHEGLSIWTWDAKTLEGEMNLQQFVDDCSDGMAPTPPDPFTLTKKSDDTPTPGMRSS